MTQKKFFRSLITVNVVLVLLFLSHPLIVSATFSDYAEEAATSSSVWVVSVTEAQEASALSVVNEAPSLEAPADQTVIAGRLLRADFKATDPENKWLSFTLVLLDGNPLPEGIEVKRKVQEIVWKTNLKQTGSYRFLLTVSDGVLTSSKEFSIVVKENPTKAALLHRIEERMNRVTEQIDAWRHQWYALDKVSLHDELNRDREMIREMVHWSIGVLRDLVKMVEQVKAAGIADERESKRIERYLSEVRAKLDPANPSSIPNQLPGLLKDFKSSNFYELKNQFLDLRAYRKSLRSYYWKVQGAADFTRLEELALQFPQNDPLPRPRTGFPELGLWSLPSVQRGPVGLIDRGRAILVRGLRGKDPGEISRLLGTRQTNEAPVLGIYSGVVFKDPSRAWRRDENFKVMDKLQSIGVRHISRVILPGIDLRAAKGKLATAEQKANVLLFLEDLKAHGMTADFTPFLVNRDETYDLQTARARLRAYSFLDGLPGVGIYYIHEGAQTGSHDDRMKIVDLIRTYFKSSPLRFYAGAMQAVAAPLRTLGQKADDGRSRKLRKAFFGPEGEVAHMAVNRGNAHRFLREDEAIVSYLDARFFKSYASRALPDAERTIHLNVPTTAQAKAKGISEDDLKQSIAKQLLSLMLSQSADTVMLRVTSTQSGGRNEHLEGAHIRALALAKKWFQGIVHARHLARRIQRGNWDMDQNGTVNGHDRESLREQTARVFWIQDWLSQETIAAFDQNGDHRITADDIPHLLNRIN